jgi:hypothetical protein
MTYVGKVDELLLARTSCSLYKTGSCPYFRNRNKRKTPRLVDCGMETDAQPLGDHRYVGILKQWNECGRRVHNVP